MFKKGPSKSELRDQLDAEVHQFLKKGGEIEQVEMGESGLIDGRYNLQKTGYERSTPTPQERTPVHNLLATIDSRRNGKTSAPASKSKPSSSPRKKVIYDDFGDPVRTIWTDE